MHYGRTLCRATASQPRRPRIEEVAAGRLVEKFSAERSARADADRSESTPAESNRSPADETFAVTVAGETHELTRAEADRLRSALGDALTERREFVRTVASRREDGSYVVERRRADSSGHRKVFESRAALGRLYAELPTEFTAADVERPGLTGGRRHMLVRHFAEHPEFDCELVSRQPLTARKRTDAASEGDADDAPEPGTAGRGTGN
ncbi:DUF7528 family protein [Halorussus halobius]|uniref:DUF7528 family protein n=1 Tax=Halorussus halobius TaxID=1710537 RepID=UPI001FCEFFE8|nr:hypothetical protein [Halorussus halobius]